MSISKNLDFPSSFSYAISNNIQLIWVIMNLQKIKPVSSTSTTAVAKDSKRDSELKAINRILDRRYEVLVELG
jgi:hypothetical protein